MTADRPRLSSSQVREWLQTYLAQLLGLDRANVDTSTSFEQFGLDSSAAVGLSGDLGDLVGQDLDVSLAYEYPSIDELVAQLEASGILAPGEPA